MKSQSMAPVLVAWLVLAGASFLYAGPQIEALGLYYDEAFLAQQARDFTEPERAAVHPPSVTTAELFGRPFPVRNAAYLGSLKSQLTIPAFALFGASKSTLRVTTLAIGLLGVLFAMLAVRRTFDDGVAIAMGALVASDPGFHFFSLFEWGPFTSLFLCRSLGVLLLLVAIERRNAVAFLSSGIAFGLGVYSRVDFAVILLGFAVATGIAARPWLVQAVRAHRGGWLLGAAGFAVAVVPVAIVLGDVFGAGGAIEDRGDFAYRVEVLRSVLDGSHFARLLAVGGRFESLFDSPARASVFPWVLAASAPTLGVIALRGGPLERRRVAWLAIAVLGVVGGMLAISGAVRAHHMLNAMPLPQLAVAHAFGSTIGHPARGRSLGVAMRAAGALGLVLVIASNLAVIADTARTIRETGGTGRFSRAVEDFARSLEAQAPEALEVVSLDWGFHEPIHFSTTRLRSREPIWKIAEAVGRGGAWEGDGDSNTLYLYREGDRDVFGLGEMFARVVRIHGERAKVETLSDGRGEPVFAVVRFDGPHTLSFERRGDQAGFRLRWRDAERPPPAPAARP